MRPPNRRASRPGTPRRGRGRSAPCRAQRGAHSVAADAAATRATAAATGDDLAVGLRRARPHRGAGAPAGRAAPWRPLVGEQQIDVAQTLAQVGVHLVAIAGAVDQAGLTGRRRGQRRRIGEFADPLLRRGRGRRRRRRPRRPTSTRRAGRAPRGARGELGAHDPVGGALVLVPLVQLRFDAELVERAAQERRLGRDAEQPDLAGGLQPDLAAAGGQHVVDSAVALAEGSRPRRRPACRSRRRPAGRPGSPASSPTAAIRRRP